MQGSCKVLRMKQIHKLSSDRTIRSFTVRGGKITPAQQRSIQELWSIYGLSLAELAGTRADCQHLFGRSAPTIMEIGFGNGNALFEMAQQNPQHNFIGVEVHQPGLGQLMMRIHRHGITNVKLFYADAIDVLNHGLSDCSLAKICLFFPDPWPKKKHHKRRIIQSPFIQLAAKKLAPNGIFHYATDWQNYADEAMEKLELSATLVNIAGRGNFSPRSQRPETKFEKRGHQLGHTIWDIIMQKASFVR